MGIFDKKSIYCRHCNKDITKEKRWNIVGGFICDACKKPLKNFGIYESSELMKLTLDDVTEFYNKLESGDASTMYIGFGGKIVIDPDDTVSISLNFPESSYKCNNIQGVSFHEPEGLSNGFLTIVADNISISVHFTRSEREDFIEACFHLEKLMLSGDKLIEELSNFVDSKIVGSVLHIDETKKKWYIGRTSIQCEKIYSYSEIEEVYTLKGDKTITSVSAGKKTGGITRGIVGGVMAGPAGAIIGTLTSSTETSAMSKETQTICVNIFVSGNENPRSILCENEIVADEIERAFSLMVKKSFESDTVENKQFISSAADEIRKYKSLFDDGIITKEEFDRKKSQLLGL